MLHLFYDRLKLLHIFYHLEKLSLFPVMVETWENPEFILSYMAKAKLQKLPVFLGRCHLKTKNGNKRVKTETLDTTPQSSCCSVLNFTVNFKQLTEIAGSLENNFYCSKNCSRTFWSIGKSNKNYWNIIPLCTSSHLIIIICMCIYLLWVLVSF